MASVTSMSGSEIARLVLGYLQSQSTDEKAWHKLALEFCKLNKTYLREEYNFLSRGIKMKYVSNPRTLVGIIREFIEIEEIVNTFFENELKRQDDLSELHRIHTLKEKVQYACRMFNAAGGKNEPSQSRLPRKRPNAHIYQSEYDSDSSAELSPHATNIQDLPGNKHPPKRRRIIDENLLLTKQNIETICIDDSKDMSKEAPLKSSTSDDSTSNTNLQMSTSKIAIGPVVYESIEQIAQNISQVINSNIDNSSNTPLSAQVNEKMDGMISIGLEDLVKDIAAYNERFEVDSLHSSSSTSKQDFYDNDLAFNYNRQLDTPVPNDANRCGRYELRSQKKPNAALNTSTESKPKKSGKAQIISNERVNILPQISVQTISDEPIIVPDESDSESAVTTTSQQQSQQQIQQQSQQPIQQMYTVVRDAQGNVFLQPITSTANDQLQFVIPSDQSKFGLDNYNISNGSNQYIISMGPSPADPLSYDEENRNRLIVINDKDVTNEGNQPIQITLEPSEEAKNTENKQGTVDKANDKPFSQLKQVSEQKAITPKQLIRSNIPNASKSLSTPRNKNPHVRVLDFNTPSRFRLSEILEGKNESFANTSRFFNETPQNQSITSSKPSSAPPKIDSAIQGERKSGATLAESAATEVFIPTNEDTVVSADGETPKVRKTNRKSVVRNFSSHKEVNSEENEKRLKRVVRTKKKICPEEGDSNESDSNNKKPEAKAPVSKEDALAEWQRIRSASNNPELFEQNLREQNSKKQEIEISTGKKKRTRKSRKKPIAKAKQAAAIKAILDESIKSVDVSMNSSLDPDTMNSTETNLEAQLLEANLKSAKKVTPVKQEIIPKSAKKKTPHGKVHIKLMPSPKNKTLKRMKSKKNLEPKPQTSGETKKDEPIASASEKPTETEPQPEPVSDTQKPTDSEFVKPIENEVAQNLISLSDVILQQESKRKQAQQTEIQSDSVSMSQSTVEVTVIKTTSEPVPVNTEADLMKYVSQANLSMSSLLETPFKDQMQMLPKTPGLTSFLSSLNTPLLRPNLESLMTASTFKDPNFQTPNLPFTPGSGFTPLFKDIISPRSDQDIVYGAANRPTDYSSSSSYYKPDESDGIDKQIQASIQSARTNSGVYSADEIEDSKIDDTMQNTLNSSSSSSSSSDSDTDSDSDTSSSSDSDTSRISHKSVEKDPQPTESVTENIKSTESIVENEKPAENVAVENEMETEPIVVDEDSTQIIKSHLVTASEVNIAQNILLAVPEAPVLNEEAEQIALLEKKKRRMQESLRQLEMKNHEKLKPKPTKKYRTIADAKRDRLRGPPVIVSPSKRKSTQPKKIVSVHSRQIYSHMVNVISESVEKPTEPESNAPNLTTERLIPEAASDNAIVDASDVSTTQNPQTNPVDEEESVEAIKSHINKIRELGDNVEPVKETGGAKKISTKGLIDMLSEKQKRFDANRPKNRTEVIAPLPLQNSRTLRSRARNQPIIRPVQSILTKPPPSATASTAKNDSNSIDSTKEKRKSKESVPEQPLKKATNETVPSKEEKVTSKKEEILSKFVTPAKEKHARQMQDLFGHCTDIDETPIKSSPKAMAKPKEDPVPCKQTPTPPKEPKRESNKFEADSSNVQDDDEENYDDEDDDSSDDEGYEMCLSIDETDKKRFFSMLYQENTSAKSRPIAKAVSIGTLTIIDDGITIQCAVSEEEELYKQDAKSVAEMKNERQFRRTTKEAKSETSNEPTSSSEAIYGKPLHTSTPSPSKAVVPKFNIRHKSSDTVSPKSAKKQNKDDLFNGIEMSIDDVLVQLHPTTE